MQAGVLPSSLILELMPAAAKVWLHVLPVCFSSRVLVRVPTGTQSRELVSLHKQAHVTALVHAC